MILIDEVFHAKAFRKIAGEAAMQETEYSHELGRQMLGLVD
jgi:hypothetical protein